MQIFVRTLGGSTITLPREGTVEDVKSAISEREGIPAAEQRLLIAGHQLEDGELVEELPEECTLHLSLALLGAGKKRKKKTYTKPKKIKGKHKKVKLAVLKYYRVDQASGKVTRLRKECPSDQCGAGIFMAMHFNRHYCGKCGLTYMLENPGKDPNADKNKKTKEAVVEEKAAPAKGGKKKK
uniref:Ubiquitin-like domain-containing protein n=1 Tax=Hemiselmis tepida TaxID=464990 RepID=A0A7S0Z2Z2_9CRYP|mmetsp:Transcript_5843/g.14975  ORF Transcript_5843/g.14975 Transcript_5843/m.14975 type:complete len:182 (+) Transcript_5843:41-586(+)|eukprot:CAMPEP_0174933988 /NCGR_PEP_ID=MMETSP1355-20121228/47810_1 /TAXON_ID=464990 /ORGANISM="Hemiselmis tepida, Strain CCMP443" /LENGTH=181 /DNA_ID=CAMNT_0016180543 /DNA_START=24 /DNA_END=569 /DNA_ORIENTATION=-